MTTYSVSKSFSTSTPRLLLGRSFTWPKDASTVNPLPRYFWIVFALAGDSTMTRPLDNGSSNDSLFDSKLTCRGTFRSRNRLNLLDQGSQHSLYFVHLSSQQIKPCG